MPGASDATSSVEAARPEPRSGVPRRSPDEARSAAIRFRVKFGLPHDDAALAAAEAGAAPDSRSRYGVALTNAELAGQLARDGWSDAKGPLLAAVDQRRDEFGGVWIDQRTDGGFVVMALPTASALSKAAVAAAAPAGAPLRFMTAEHSLATLVAAQELLTNAQVDSTAPAPRAGNPFVSLREKGFPISASGVHHSSNRLMVAVHGLTKERLLSSKRSGTPTRSRAPFRRGRSSTYGRSTPTSP